MSLKFFELEENDYKEREIKLAGFLFFFFRARFGARLRPLSI